MDVSRWLGEDDEALNVPPPAKKPAVGDETVAGNESGRHDGDAHRSRSAKNRKKEKKKATAGQDHGQNQSSGKTDDQQQRRCGRRRAAALLPQEEVASFESQTSVRAANEPRKSAALLGLAFDNDDGQTRLTRGKNFLLLGGSQESHAVMQETAIKINEHLDKRGKRLQDVSVDEIREICRELVE